MRRAVLLDRDGVLNALVWYADARSYESPRFPHDVELLPGVPAALRQLREAGWLLALASNQPNLAKGKSTRQELDAVHAELVAQLAAQGAWLDSAHYCFHHPDFGPPCTCRKPLPGLLLAAAAQHSFDLSISWMVGDTDADIAAGKAAGCSTAVLLHAPSADRRGQETADATCADLAGFARRLLAGSFGAP